MRLWMAWAVTLWLISPGFANDAHVVGEGGRVRLLKDERTTVRMVRESVRIDVYPSSYDVEATFLFANDGPAVTVTMGFPESGGGDVSTEHYVKASGFRHFATWVDGQRVVAKRQASAGVGDGYRAFWVKQVQFGKGQRRTVRVQYRSAPGGDVTSTRSVSYSFTGGNWRGKVEETLLRLVVHLPGTTLVSFRAGAEGKSLSGVTRTGNEFVFRQRDWQAQGDAGLAYKQTMSGWMFLDGFQDPSDLSDPRLYRENGSPADAGLGPEWEEITQPGLTEELDWAPPAVLRRGIVFLRLDVLAELLQPGTLGSHRALATVLTWYPAVKEAVLYARGRSFGFARGRKVMLLDRQTEVPLPAAPLVSSPPSRMYVPVPPILEMFGGAATVRASDHRIHLDLPPAPGGSGK